MMQSSGGGAMESSYSSTTTRSGNGVASITESGEQKQLISEKQISRTLNESTAASEKKTSVQAIAVIGGRPHFMKTLVGRSVERKWHPLVGNS